MTAPVPYDPNSPLPPSVFNTPAGGTAPADYTPAATGGSGGATSIWNLPKQLQKGSLLFDLGDAYDSYSRSGKQGPAMDQRKTGGKAESWLSPQEVFDHVAAMAQAGYVTDSKGNLTREALVEQQKFLLIQQALSAGPWGKVYTSGSFDGATQTALQKALMQFQSQAKGAHIDFLHWLVQSSAKARINGNYPGSGGSNSAPPPVPLQDPETIRQAAQAAALDALGHGLSDAQLQKFVDQFQSAQTSAHQQEYANGSTSYTAPDLTSQATAYAQQADPQGYQSNQQQAYMSALVNLLAGPGDAGRPTQGVTPKAT